MVFVIIIFFDGVIKTNIEMITIQHASSTVYLFCFGNNRIVTLCGQILYMYVYTYCDLGKHALLQLPHIKQNWSWEGGVAKLL